MKRQTKESKRNHVPIKFPSPLPVMCSPTKNLPSIHSFFSLSFLEGSLGFVCHFTIVFCEFCPFPALKGIYFEVYFNKCYPFLPFLFLTEKVCDFYSEEGLFSTAGGGVSRNWTRYRLSNAML